MYYGFLHTGAFSSFIPDLGRANLFIGNLHGFRDSSGPYSYSTRNILWSFYDIHHDDILIGDFKH